MHLLKVLYACFCLIILSTSVNAQQDIELLGADFSEYDKSMIDAERLIGNVKFRQQNVYMDCDSAWFFHGQNRVEAFGHIYIRQTDTINLWGNHLLYEGDTKQATVTGDVRLTDRQMSLQTEALFYDLNTKTAYYVSGGRIQNGQDRLYSRKGQYYSRSKEFHFRDSVRLVNPEYQMDSDTLRYNTETRIATFYGPTWIRSEENTIFCRYGWYNTLKNTSEFSKGASIENKQNTLKSDSMVYNRNTGVGKAFRNIRFTDTAEKIVITGDYGIHRRMELSTKISGHPKAIKYMDDDTIYIYADTLADKTDTSNQSRTLSAYHHTRIISREFQAICDSMIYNFNDSLIVLNGHPFAWNENNQINGDTIVIYRKNNRFEYMDVLQNAFIVMLDTLDLFNQVKGRQMRAWYGNNRLDRIAVNGNGESIYYAKEDDGTYSGVNSITCSEMLIFTAEGKVSNIIFFTQPEGSFYPIEQFPEDERILSGFQWKPEWRPVLK